MANDIHLHFTTRCEALPGKALVVAYSRRIAAELAGSLRERFGEETVDCVISASATDEKPISLFRRSKPQLLHLAKDFRNPDRPLRIVVVKDMWLTGFDAPVLHTLYIDKPMQDHGLLQIERTKSTLRLSGTISMAEGSYGRSRPVGAQSSVRPSNLLQSVSITIVFAARDIATYCNLYQ